MTPHATTTPSDLTDDDLVQTASAAAPGLLAWLGYLGAGTGLGVLFMQSEVASWYRIQEMFRFQSIHMYGVIAVAVTVAAIGRAVLLRLGARSLDGARIETTPKTWTPYGARYLLGGAVFGLGWALLGACPGPIFTLIGAGHTVYVVALVSAAGGTYLYGAVRQYLPH